MTSTENPIDNDDRLRRLLSKIRQVKSQTAYNAWRKEFLKIYTKYLDKNGILNGKDANYRLLKQLGNLSNRIQLVVPILENGTLNTSTKGRRLLKNLTTEVVATERKVQELLPKTHADEERFGFDKFELAAVLLEDGFHGYDAMNESRAILEAIVEHIQGDSQNTNEVAILHQYSDSVESFVRVMEDLKLVQIMNHCVDVVYKGAQRPEPKPPPPPSENENDDDDEEELPEDSSICSDLEGDNLKASAPSSRSSKDAKNPRASLASSKPKKKKIKPGETVSNKAPTKKKKPKKKGASNSSPAVGVEDEDEENNLRAVSKGSFQSTPSSKSSRKPFKKQPSRRKDDQQDDDSSNSGDSSDSDSDDEDEQDQNSGEPPEFLLYFDPKTNSIGSINREQAVAKSTLIVDKNKQGDGEAAYADAYKNVVESQDEKQQLIFLLKKLEKQKPQEESWLDAIKREKAEAAAKSNGKKFHKSTAGISGRRSSANGSMMKSPNGRRSSATGSIMKSPTGRVTKTVGNTTFTNPPAESGSIRSTSRRSSASSKPKSYKLKIADKPDASGWTKPASSRGLKQ